MELHVQRRRLARRPLHVVNAEHQRVRPRLLGYVAGDQTLDAAAPGASAILTQPNARRRDADSEPLGIAGPGTDRVQAEAAQASLPLGPRRVIPERPVERPGAAAVRAAKQRRRGDARPEHAVLDARFDCPDSRDRGAGLLGERRPLRLLPFARGVVAHEQVRTELAVRDRGVTGAAPRIANRELHLLAGELPADDLHRPLARPAQHEQAFARPDQQLGLPRRLGAGRRRAAGDCRDDVHLVVGPDGAVERRLGLVHEQLDVFSKAAAFIQNPATKTRVTRLQLPEQLARRAAFYDDHAVADRPVTQ